MQILVQKVRDEAPGYCISNKFPGDVGIADPTTPLWVAMVVDATSQVWEFLAAPTSLFGDFSPVSVCFDITFYFEGTLGFIQHASHGWMESVAILLYFPLALLIQHCNGQFSLLFSG